MRKTLHITNQQALQHLSKQPNQSSYITKLILQDINKPKINTKEDVLKIIKEYLNEYLSTIQLQQLHNNQSLQNQYNLQEDYKNEMLQSISEALGM